MSLRRNSREAYSSGDVVGNPRNPSMVSVALRKDGCDRECRDCVSRGKTGGEDGTVAAKKGVREVALRSDVRGPEPSAHTLHDARKNQAIREGFSRQQSRLLLVRVFAYEAVG